MSTLMKSVWRWPLMFAALTWIGLLDALLVDNMVARIFAWLVLAVPAVFGTKVAAGAPRRMAK
jgi:hypothetical protein